MLGRNLIVTLALALAPALALSQPAKSAAKTSPRPGVAKPAASYKQLQYPPLNKVTAPQPVRFEMPNGISVYLVEDHELPTVTVSAYVRTGSRWEPAEKAGLASITGTVMRTGGTETRPGDALDEELDRLAAFVETGIMQDNGRAIVSVLKEDTDKCLEILADILQHPAFPNDKIELAKIRARDQIARRNDEPGGIAFREFNKLVYGKDSPYARQTEYATIAAVTRDDLIAFHKRFFQPENVILGAWGDFDAGEMRARIQKVFETWQRGGQPKPQIPEVSDAARNRAGVYAVTKEDMRQSWVLMGYLGGRRDDPDYYALTVMDNILGGGFASRMFSNIRSEQGLAYAVGSGWNAGWDRPGTFMAYGSSKPETTIKILNSMKYEISKMAEEGATDAELTRAKDSILKGFAFDFDSVRKVVERRLLYDYYGYPSDYLERYQAGIRKVTKSDVARVAKQYLKPDQLAILIVGNDKYEQPLSSVGAVTRIDITIPPPK